MSELARAMWHRRRLVAVIIVACVAAAGIVTRLQPKVYRAQTSVFFPQSRETALGAALGAAGQNPVLLSALGGVAGGSAAAGLCKAIAESYSVQAEICRGFRLQRRFRADSLQEAANQLRDATWVNITPEGLLVIRVDTTDAELSADLANAYDRVVERRYRDSSVARARQEREFLAARGAQAAAELTRAETELKAYQQRADAVLVPEEAPPILQQLADARTEQARAEVESEALRRRRDNAVAQLGRLAVEEGDKASERSVYRVPWELSSETTADNPDIADLRANLVALEVKLAAARHNLTSEHPDVKRLQTEVEETRTRLAQEARKAVTSETRTRSPVYAAALEQVVSLETEAMAQEARARGLGELVRRMESQAAALPQRLLQYSRLDREVRAREAVATTLESQLEAAKLKALQEQPVFEVLDAAVPPERHYRPKLLVNVAVAFIFGAFFGIAIAAALGAPPREPAA
ncbi:MAG TPA: GNVR domain-containing protein [Armatimonadota bacterium]|nr:GNVR domain-containing protein [Armatimonadota bacterium]